MVLNEAKAKLRALQPIAARMNQASDKLRDEIKKIEEEIAKLNIGLEVTLPGLLLEGEHHEEYAEEMAHDLETGDELGYARVATIVSYDLKLGYRRHLNAWRLVAVKYRCVRGQEDPAMHGSYDWDIVEQEATPLLEAPRHVRIAAAAQIPGLLDLLKEKAEEGIAAVEKVTDSK